MKINAKTSPGTAKSLTGADNATTYKALSVLSPPSTPQSVVNLSYLENNYNPLVVKTGDVRFTLTPQTPTGYLRCNGGTVNKTTYPELYAVIGDSFSGGVRIGNGKPHVYQYEFNTTLSRELYSWTQGTNLPAANTYIDGMVTKNKVYLFSRFNGSGTYSNNCYVANISSSGVIGAWGSTSNFPIKASAAQTLIFNGKIYVFGGYDGGSTARSTIYRSIVDTTGNLGSWGLYNTLPFTLYRSQVIVTKNRVYVIGGYINESASGLVYYSEIDSNGDFGIWVAGPSLPVDIADHSVAVIKNRVYVIGGLSSGVDSAYCWVGTLDAKGAIVGWSAGESLPETNRLSSVVVVRNRVYVLGGLVAGSPSTKVYGSAIAADGSLSGWEIYGDLPSSFYAGTALLTSKGVYIIGGYRSGVASTRTDYVDGTGGLDDYSSYYGSGVYPTNTNATTFTLPDYSKLESDNGIYAFVKT